MAKYKTAELDGALLDLAVLLAQGHTKARIVNGRAGWNFPLPIYSRPSATWKDGGEIIERERIMLEPPWTPNTGGNGVWLAWTEFDRSGGSGDSPLVAAMRAYVADKLGDEVELEGA